MPGNPGAHSLGTASHSSTPGEMDVSGNGQLQNSPAGLGVVRTSAAFYVGGGPSHCASPSDLGFIGNGTHGSHSEAVYLGQTRSSSSAFYAGHTPPGAPSSGEIPSSPVGIDLGTSDRCSTLSHLGLTSDGAGP
jgi:hypothetical protein